MNTDMIRKHMAYGICKTNDNTYDIVNRDHETISTGYEFNEDIIKKLKDCSKHDESCIWLYDDSDSPLSGKKELIDKYMKKIDILTGQ